MNRSGWLHQRAAAPRDAFVRLLLGDGLRLDPADAVERRLGHGEEHRGTSSSTMIARIIADVGAGELGGARPSRLLLAEAGGRRAVPVVRLEQLALAGPHAARPRPARRGRGRARAACRARRAGRARRRRCRRARRPGAPPPPGTSRRRRAAAAGRSGRAAAGRARCGRRRATTSTSTSTASIGKASTSVGPCVAEELLVERGDVVSLDEQHAQLGVAAHALGGEHRLGERAPSARRRRRRCACSSATKTSGSPSPPTFCGRPSRGRDGSATRSVAVAVGALVGGDDVGDDPVAHDVGARQVHEGRGRRCRRGSRSRPTRPLRPPGTSTWVVSPVTTTLDPKPMRVRNIFICSGVVFWASSRMMKLAFSVRPRMNASGATSTVWRSSRRLRALGLDHVVERVVERAQVGVDLGHEVAGQEAEALAGLDRRAGEDDALHLLGLQRLHRHGDRQPALAGAGRAEPEGDDVAGGWRRRSASARSSSGARCGPWRRAGPRSASTSLGRSSARTMSIERRTGRRCRWAGPAGGAARAPRTAGRPARRRRRRS